MSKKRLSPEAKFRVFVLLVLVIIVGLGGLILYNIKTNPSFWETSVSSCITIIIALVFSYWLVQRKTISGNKKKYWQACFLIFALNLKRKTCMIYPKCLRAA